MFVYNTIYSNIEIWEKQDNCVLLKAAANITLFSPESGKVSNIKQISFELFRPSINVWV